MGAGSVTVAIEIEEVYVEIGRTVMLAALRQVQAERSLSDQWGETSVTVRIRIDGEPTDHRRVACCVCIQDAGGAWVCAGPRCPSSNPPRSPHVRRADE